MIKRIARTAVISAGAVLLVITLVMKLTAVPIARSPDLAGLVFRADADVNNGFWILQLHGNADAAFSRWQVRHCEALREAGFNVLEIDYRGFGRSPGQPSEAGMYEDAEAAYQVLLRRVVAANRIVILGHSLGSGPAVRLATQPYSHSQKLYDAANNPKRLITFDTPSNDGFGGHVDALFEHVNALQAALTDVVPGFPQPRAP